MRTIIFADLDGTILEENYSFHEKKPTITRLFSLNFAIVFCSSKTRSEIEFYRKEMDINDPFISENGAAIFVPSDYFGQNQSYAKRTKPYDIIELGVPYSAIRMAFEKVGENCGCEIVGFGDMTAKELAENSGLTIDLAILAKQREYTEPFRIKEGQEGKVFDAIRKEHLSCIKGGKYYHLTWNHDKAKATIILKNLYAQKLGELVTIGVGDQLNDLEMLQVVDKPFLVRGNKLLLVWENILKTALG